jgi:hypothetical protein
VETAFNLALSDAFELASGRRLRFWVEPELQHAKLAGLVPVAHGFAAFTDMVSRMMEDFDGKKGKGKGRRG